jgi:cell division protein FtsW
MSAAAVLDERPIDPVLIGACLGLVAIGAVMVGSASIALAERETGEPLYYLYRHLGALGIGTVGAVLAAMIPLDVWYRLSGLVVLAGVGLLAIVLVPGIGQTVNGSTRWVELGPLTFQASEPARLCLAMYLSSYAVRHHKDLSSSFVGFLKPMLIVAGACMLLLLEPDYGAVVVLTVTSLGIVFAAGARIRDFSVAVLVAVPALAMLALSSAYRIRRLVAFLDPWEDPYETGFQLTQSLIAVGRGDLFGVGLGASVQKLFYLPEAHTDFVFAVLAEELGFFGATLVIALFAVLIYRAITLGQRALDAGLPFHGLVAIGIGLMLGLEAFINIGVNLGLLPTKGLALPLISYGRSSAVVSLVAVGLLARVYYELRGAERKAARRERERS